MKIGKRPGKTSVEGDIPGLVLCVELMQSECLAPHLLERRIKSSISYTITKCSCGDSMYRTEMAGQALEGKDVDSFTISSLSLTKDNGVTFMLMEVEKVSRFMETHQPNCGLVIKLLGTLDDCSQDPSNDELGGQNIAVESTSDILTSSVMYN